MLALLLLACNPWTAVHEHEQVWWDADRVESELGIDLVEISAGEPIGYWPRLVVRSDGIEMDNRAWFLNLPDHFFLTEDLDHETRMAWLMEPAVVLSLDEGLVVEDATRESPTIEELYAHMEGYSHRLNELWRLWRPHTSEKDLEVLIDEHISTPISLIVEPDIPWETVYQVIFTAGQATFDSLALVGRVGNRLRTPMTGRSLLQAERVCVMGAVQQIDQHGVWIDLQGLPALVSASGCQGSSWESSLQSIESVLDHCTPRWKAELAEVGFDPGETDTWACSILYVSAAPEVSIETLLTGMSQNYQAYPRIDQIIAGQGPEDEACEEGVHISGLEKSQLDGFCDRVRVTEQIEHWGDPRYQIDLSSEDIPSSVGAETRTLKSLLGTGSSQGLDADRPQGLGADREEVSP